MPQTIIGWIVFATIVVLPLVLWIRRKRTDHESALDPALEGVRDLKKRWGFYRRVMEKVVAVCPWITADRVTIARLPLVTLTVALYVLGWGVTETLYLVAFGVNVFNAILDSVDGMIALILGGTEYGKKLDPLVDKVIHAILLATIGSVWLLQGRWAVFAVFLTPIIVSLTYAYLLTRERARGNGHKDPTSKPHGKLKTVLESVATCAILLAQTSTESTMLLIDAWILLAGSVFLAHRSLQGQRGRPTAPAVAPPSP